ncbi:MAG: hypothetical protein WAN66_29320 [Limnoraphis robusta]|uniref:Uncharacterized protein n=2 Tax=Limnoraphis robusta TaxID=1118279 RepID=A0A0F5YGK8_9CYAN|nr:hypothetical protein [Limnoraphis robusta]KKD37898.1 hypothetical protein WN50_11835 [Limnoraphis robusta CS-951]MEA5498697.1 hypothetical protein [Limnoraphis robusta BA-68 BA1]MEA5518397.1 hypothetical protein [Limnoraphis robusta CCNP1315]MEA5542941.1 hypothetical protein [Limnoraphis robusta Tam1]MEA5547778.1 hypothetical protein [Limnoraphis robusta CCNP1324]
MIQVKSEQEVLHEGLRILLSNMEPSKVARFWAACNLGSGDYLKLKDQLFEQESVASLYSEVLEFQESKRKT